MLNSLTGIGLWIFQLLAFGTLFITYRSQQSMDGFGGILVVFGYIAAIVLSVISAILWFARAGVAQEAKQRFFITGLISLALPWLVLMAGGSSRERHDNKIMLQNCDLMPTPEACVQAGKVKNPR